MTTILTTMAPPNFLQLVLSLTTVNIFGVAVTSLPHDQCPDQCLCSDDQQNSGKIIVNCTDTSLSAVPVQFPKGTLELYLSKNPLFRVDISNMGHLSRLEKMDFSSCFLRTFTASSDLSKVFPRLHVVDLSDNDLDSIPQNLPRSVEKLYLSHNSISDVSDLSYLIELKEVFLDNNHISSLTANGFQTDDGARLLNLHKLALHSNRISTIDSAAFNGLPALSALTLSNNYIRQVEKNMFENLTNLGHLDLSQNSLTQLSPGIFRPLRYLKYVDLSQNHLSSFPMDLPMLEWFDVSQNAITRISEDSKPDVYPIEVLNLAKNPFVCDCYLRWLKQIHERREYLLKHLDIAPEDYNPTCASPPELAGISWNMLQDNAFECQADTQAPRRVETVDAGKEMNVAVRARAGLVTDSTVQVIWSAESPNYTGANVIIQYYVFGHRASMKYVEIAVAQKEFVLKHLKSMTNYVICLIPKATGISRNEQANPSIVLDDCIEVATKAASPRPQASRLEIVFYYALGMFATFIGIFATIGGCALLYGLWNHKNTHWSSRYVTEDSYLDGSTYATDEPVTTEKKQHRD